MPLVRRAVSPLGLSISGFINQFMSANAAAMSQSSSVDEGVEAISEAIAYGIAKGFSDPSIAAAFASGGVVPPTGNPLAGQVLHTAIAGVTTEP